MAIGVGDRIPDVKVMTMTADGVKPAQTSEVLGRGRVVLFAVPGAFTPTCSDHHLPGFVLRAEDLKAKGVDTIACISVNDAFVMGAWGKQAGVGEKVTMLADGNGDFVKALGLEMDASKFGMGTRGKRFSMLVRDGRIEQLNVEEPGAFKVSSAEHMIEQLGTIVC